MGRARPVNAGKTSMITRRCYERQALLRPTKDGRANAVHGYVLALSTRDTGVECHAYCAMTNHEHNVSTDVDGNRPLFCQQLHSNIARAINCQLGGRTGPLWEPGLTYSNIELADRAAVLKEIVYVITNPIRAGLVTRIEDYPGFVTRPEQIGEPQEFDRPAEFFRAEGADAAEDRAGGPRTARDRARHHARLEPGATARDRDPLPARLTLTFTKPPQFADMSLADFRKLVRDAVDVETKRILAERRAAGRRRVVGAAAIYAQDPRKVPGQPDEDTSGARPGRSGAGGTHDAATAGATRERASLPSRPTGGGELNPRFAVGRGDADRSDRARRSQARELAESYPEFWKAHARARAAFRDGDHTVAFPQGTWAAVKLFGLAAEEFDP